MQRLFSCGLRISVLGMTTFLASACAFSEQGDEPLSSAEEEIIVHNSMGLNGIGVNGIGVNGIGVNGIGVNGIGVNGIGVNGVGLSGTSFYGTRQSDGVPISGLDFIGAEMPADLLGGGSTTLRIDDIVQSSDPDILLYTVSYQKADSSWAYLCGDNAGSAIRALPLRGYWDLSQGTATGGDHVDTADIFTFACEGFALAKCVEFGYKPWQSITECRNVNDCQMLSLAPFHQACTRMLRADYCGDGTPHTLNGTLINIWDNFDVQSPDNPGWALEAEWAQDGAGCVVHTRLGDTAASDYIAANCPSIWDPQATSCGDASSSFFTANGFSTPLASRVLLRNESNPQ